MHGGPTEKDQRAPPLQAAARAPPKKEMKPQATTRAVPRVAEPPKPNPKTTPSKGAGRTTDKRHCKQNKNELNHTAILDQAKPTRPRSKMRAPGAAQSTQIGDFRSVNKL